MVPRMQSEDNLNDIDQLLRLLDEVFPLMTHTGTVDRVLEKGHFRGQGRTTFQRTFFRRKLPSLYGEGVCGERMFHLVARRSP